MNKKLMIKAHILTKEICDKYGDVDYKVQLGLCISYLLEEQKEIAVNDTEAKVVANSDTTSEVKNSIVNKLELNSLVNTFKIIVRYSNENAFYNKIENLTKQMNELEGILEVKELERNIMGIKYNVTCNIDIKIPNYKIVAVNRLNVDKYIYSQIDNTVEVPENIKTLYVCQHCNTNRKRKMYYIFYNEVNNNFMVVGSSCCKTYFGIDIEKVLNKYQKVLNTIGGYAGDTLYSPVGIISKVVAFDELYKTEYKAYNTYKDVLVDNILEYHKKHDLINYFEKNQNELFKKASETIQYILDMPNENNSEYLKNLKDVLSNEWMDKKFIKYILYCTKLVEIDKDKKRIKETKNPSGYVGEIKDRLDLTLTVTNIIELDNYYSNDTTYMYLFTDKENNVFKWVTSAIKLDKDKTYKIKGTVKQHTEYKGIKQTVLTRCKIEK